MKLDDIFLGKFVSKKMLNPLFWYNNKHVTNQLMSIDEIFKLNRNIINNKDTNVIDLENYKMDMTPAELINQLSEIKIPNCDLFVNSKIIDKQIYFKGITNSIKHSIYIEKYGIIVNNSNLKSIPTDDIIVHIENNLDDIFQNTSLNINEPFLIYDECIIDSKKYYWGYSSTYSGWINASNIAICKSKNEWLDAWKYDINKEDFLLITTDKIILNNNLELMLGTVLKIASENESLNNYAVYIPIKDNNNMYKKKLAVIPKSNNVNVGILPLTENNIINVAFSCLGNKYGWGGINGLMDCSSYVKSVFKCFGIELPRDVKNQIKIPNLVQDISNLNNIEKEKIISDLPLGSLLYTTSHVMIYLGKYDNQFYFINAIGSITDDKTNENKKIYSITVNTLSTRKNGVEIIDELTKILKFI